MSFNSTHCFLAGANVNTLTLMETSAVVVNTGSFTAAAERLRLSKSFVSKKVTLLEQGMGTRLLYRITRNLSLSDEGSRFYNHCKLIMAEAENALMVELVDTRCLKPMNNCAVEVSKNHIWPALYWFFVPETQ